MDISLDAHDTGGGSFALVDLVEVYPADYAIPEEGFDLAHAERRFCGLKDFTFLGFPYDREYVDRGDVQRYVGKKENSVTATFSNIDRALAAYVQSEDVEGKWIVYRVIDPLNSATLDDSVVIFAGRLDPPGDFGDETGTLPATQRFGQINLQLPPRTFGPNDPKGRAPSDPKCEGFRFTATQTTVLWTERQRDVGFGGLFGLSHKVNHSQQASSHTQIGADAVVCDGFGRVQMGVRYLGTIDIGNDINLTAGVMEGPIDEFISIKQTNPKFTQISADPALRYGYVGGEGPVGRVQQPVVAERPDLEGKIPGDGYYSRTVWFAGYVQGSTPDVDEAEAPTWMVLVKAKIVPLPDGSGAFVLQGWTHNPAFIARFLFTDERYFNEGPDSVNDPQCIETAEHCAEYVVDNSQGERAFVTEGDAAEQGVSFQRFRSTGVVDSLSIRVAELGETVGGISDATQIPADLEPFDPTAPPEPTDPEDADAPTRVYLRERYTTNLTITQKVTAVDFLYGSLAKTGRLFYKRNGTGRIDICSERPADHTYLRGAVAAGDSTVKVLDVVPWKTGRLLTQRLLTGAHQITSEVRDVVLARYTAEGNSVTLAVADSGGVMATASGVTFSGGSPSVPAAATITIGGAPAEGDTVTATINGVSVTYTLDANDTTATVAAMLARLVNATPKLRQFIKAEWETGSTVASLTVRFGVLTLNEPLSLAHVAYVATPTTVPTLTPASDGSLPAGKVYLAYAFTNDVGETGLSPMMSVSVTANQKVNIPSITLPAGASGVNWYVGKYVNNAELVFHSSNDGSAFAVSELPASTSDLPLDLNTTGEELMRVAASYAAKDQDGVWVDGVFYPYPLWAAGRRVNEGDILLPPVENGHKYRATNAGALGSSAPAFPVTPSGTVVSGEVTLEEYGPTVIGQAGLKKANIHGKTFKFPLSSQQSSVNQAKGAFFDAKDDYAETPIEVNDYGHQERTRKTNTLDVDLSGFDNYHQASRQLNFELSKLRDGNKLAGWQTGPKAMLHEEGDVVCVSASCGGFVNWPLRLEQIGIGAGPPKGTYNVKLTGRQYSTLMFSDLVRQHSIKLPTTLFRVNDPPPTPTGLTLSEHSVTATTSTLHGEFAFAPYRTKHRARVLLKRDGESVFSDAGVVLPDEDGNGYFDVPGMPPGTHEVKIQPESGALVGTATSPESLTTTINGTIEVTVVNTGDVAATGDGSFDGALTAGGEMRATGKVIAEDGLAVGNSASATTPGSVVKRMPVYDAAGALLGYVPIYDDIT